MISNREFGRRCWAINGWVAALGVSLVVALSSDAAFAQPAPVCSNQAQINACVAAQCGICDSFSATCGLTRGFCELACGSVTSTCISSCGSDLGCIFGCIATLESCIGSCATTCNLCVAQCRGPCDNLCLVCDAGGPYSIACDTDGALVIQLDGSGSDDPEDVGLTYEWTTNCPGAAFNDNTIPSPQLTLAAPLNCLECSVTLTVTEEDGGTSTCTAPVNVTDDGNPFLEVPPAFIGTCYTSLTEARQDACDATLLAADDNCDPSLTCDTTYQGPNADCSILIFAEAIDDCGNHSAPQTFSTRVDEERPKATCSALAAEYQVDENCEATVSFAGQITDNCCLEFVSVTPKVTVTSGAATVTFDENMDCEIRYATGPIGALPNVILVDCVAHVSAVTECPVVVTMELTGRDCCGNAMVEPCVATTNVVDKIRPDVVCPPNITLDRGDKICNDDVKNWLESATATDNCDGEPVITNDAPECGFPYGSTTEVEFTATDDCGNTNTCFSTITIEATPRVSSTQKGSLLVFSDVEIRWDADGALTQDTFLDVSNDADAGSVDVQAWFINGDAQVEQIVNHAGEIIQGFEPGWNTADCRFELTKNQPHFWSAARGSNKCQPFVVLDEDGPGRPDPRAVTAAGPRVLRGYVVMVAVANPSTVVAGHLDHPNAWQEIRWNHLKGDAVVINYTNGGGYEYNAWAYQARCGETGEPLLDCQTVDANGTCCTAEIIPGRLDMDGFQYDINFDELLLDFYASGSTGLSSVDTTVMVDTALTLHTVDIDLRQDGDGPLLTKAEFEIFNENESKFSGTRRCICCWDQTLLSNYVRNDAIPNHFLRTLLRTNKGSARIDGVHSTDCDYFDTCGIWPRVTDSGWVVAGVAPNFSHDTALLGVAVKELTFSGSKSNFETAAMNLVGTGEEQSRIFFDVDLSTGELRAPAPTIPTAPRPRGTFKGNVGRGNVGER